MQEKNESIGIKYKILLDIQRPTNNPKQEIRFLVIKCYGPATIVLTSRRRQSGKESFQRGLQLIDWQIIIEKHGPAVWKTAYRLLGNRADAADCFQETFLSALRFRRRRQVRNFQALLIHIATARAMDQLRQRFHRARAKLREFFELSAKENE